MSATIEIRDRGWKALLSRLRYEQKSVKVGVLQSAGDAGEDLTMVELAAVHEFGSEKAGVPERSFIRRTFREKERETLAFAEKLTGAIVVGKITPAQALEALGQWGAAEVKKTITQGAGVPPPNAPSTIEKKGSDRPLVDTGRLINAIAHEVE